MSVATLKIGKRDFVVVPKRDFERIQQENSQYRRQQQEDAEDLAIIRKRAKDVIRPYSERRKDVFIVCGLASPGHTGTPNQGHAENHPAGTDGIDEKAHSVSNWPHGHYFRTGHRSP